MHSCADSKRDFHGNMTFFKMPLIDFVVTTIVMLILSDFTLCLRNVSVTIPAAVKRGDNAILICNYDIENDTLYSVKWYRGRREFYRYTPKEKPAWKIFSTINSGINVDTLKSNASYVVLVKAPSSISGKYACEVSADAPFFHTLVSFGEMNVVEMPAQRPIVTGIHSRYRLGDIINGNCSSDYSKPAANLTWWINDIQVPPNYLRTYDIIKHDIEQLESSVLEINFIVTLQHFIKGRLKLKCSARIYRIYHGETEKYLEEDKPRILASGRSPEMYPFDQHNDEFEDEDGVYLNRYNEYSSSSTSGSVTITEQLYVVMGSFISSLMLSCWHLITSLKRKLQSVASTRTALKAFNKNTSCTSVSNKQRHPEPTLLKEERKRTAAAAAAAAAVSARKELFSGLSYIIKAGHIRKRGVR